MKTARIWLSGFLLLGVVLGLPGSLLVAWQYHIDVAPPLIGLHFLALNAGYVGAAALAQKLDRWFKAKTLTLGACGMAALSLAALFVAAPPAAILWRLASWAMLGASAGVLGTALLYTSEAYFREKKLAAMNQVGTWFVCGCLVSTAVAALTYLAGAARIEAAVLTVVPVAFIVLLARSPSPTPRKTARDAKQELLRDALRDLRSIATILFGLLLFFQFGNEWAIAGWLPLFLIHRFGCNPVWAIGVLALFFLALLAGRWAARKGLLRFNHRRLLLVSIAAAMCGCFTLSLAHSLAGAAVAVTVIGGGFAPIYPLIAEQLDERFTFHPGFYNGAVAIAITGAMGVPWLLGFVDAWFGMRYVMLGPALGSMVVLLLSLLLMLETHLMRDKTELSTSD
ncbi:MAG TPA: MFS transporter [Bryobacteraceae bacterium]|jgi:fucose permease|nr:MFS transporter [Bryobacteraceae bacterium]